MHAKNIQSPMFNDGQIHIAKWVRNALDLNDGDELLFEVVDNKNNLYKSRGLVGRSSLPPLTQNVLNENDTPQK